MVQASVGFHCPDCAHAGAQQVVRGPAAFGGRHLPVVTITLIAVNVVAFVADLLTDRSLFEQGALIGAWGTRFGDASGVAFGEPWRLVTGGFLHAGIMHVGFNMVALWFMGSQLEPALGRIRFLALYLAGLLAGALGVMLVQPTTPTVGASGAIFGLFAAMFVLQRSRGINPWQSGIAGLILVNLLITFAVPGISIAGHLGGLVGGALGALTVAELEKRTRSPWPATAACAALAVACYGAAIWAANSWANPILSFGR